MNEPQKLTLEELKNEAVNKLRNGAELSGKKGALAPLIKMIIESALEAELQEHLTQGKGANRKNGKAPKNLRTSYGKVKINPNRDRQGTFQPQLIKKREVSMGKAVDDKIISLAARGLSHSDISEWLEDIYGLEVSNSLISRITDTVINDVKTWQERPLEPLYVVMWLDAIHFKVKEEGRIISKAVYCLMGLNASGEKELLGMYIGTSESASYWLKVLNDLKSRGVEDILIACIDNLKGFKEAIAAVYPKAEIQQCMVHQVRNSLQHVTYRERRELKSDMKAIYNAPTLEQAENALLEFEEKWAKKYSHVVRSWRNNWPELSTYFRYPPEIRRIIYTTNMIESFHSQLRKITKSKRVFSSDMALMKLLYLVQENVTKKWTKPITSWGQVLSQLSIMFGTRLPLK